MWKILFFSPGVKTFKCTVLGALSSLHVGPLVITLISLFILHSFMGLAAQILVIDSERPGEKLHSKP